MCVCVCVRGAGAGAVRYISVIHIHTGTYILPGEIVVLSRYRSNLTHTQTVTQTSIRDQNFGASQVIVAVPAQIM